MPIQRLDDAIVSRIAAGEVVERPESVVKELVENSLDAGATRVAVQIEQGGIKLIRVADNGFGIEAREAPVAFERFATSKIASDADIQQVRTLGFRGEALPSIAAVASMEMVTRASGSEGAVRCAVEYGDASPATPAGSAEGTVVAVRDLFRKTPARYKFLSSANYEASRVQKLITAMALVRPDIQFALSVDGNERFRSPGTGDMRAVIAAAYGGKIADAMMEIPAAADGGGGMTLTGMAGQPSARRRNRNFITFSVNGRLIVNRRLLVALVQAYRGHLPEGEFPIAVLSIEMPHRDVDVNMHPAKNDVRFARGDLVFALVQRTIRQLLQDQAPVPGVARFGAGGDAPAPANGAAAPVAPAGGAPAQPGATAPGWDPGWPAAPAAPGAPPPAQFTHKEVLAALRFVGQVKMTYLVAEGPEGVYLIDQHAASERVHYEAIKERIQSGAVESQQLMDPEIVDLPPEQRGMLSNCLETLRQTGFQFEEYGGDAIVIRAVPAIMTQRRTLDVRTVFTRMLDDINDGRGGADWRERTMATIACHSSVRAGQAVDDKSAARLIADLERAKHPQTCPHGRPTMLHLSARQLASEFGRS